MDIEPAEVMLAASSNEEAGTGTRLVFLDRGMIWTRRYKSAGYAKLRSEEDKEYVKQCSRPSS